jgi:hypothetical protein
MIVALGDLIHANANVVLLQLLQIVTYLRSDLFVHRDIETMKFEFCVKILALLSCYVCHKNYRLVIMKSE